ncbi:hypothetical protein [Kribbella lupini]
MCDMPRGVARFTNGGLVVEAAPEFVSTDEATVVAVRRHLQQIAALRPIP